MKTLGIFGNSGFAREVGDIACDLGYKLVYVARDQPELDVWAFPDEAVLESIAEKVNDMMSGLPLFAK